MDQPYSPLSTLYTTFKTEESYPASPDYCLAKQESSEYPGYYDIETFYDSIAYDKEPPCSIKHVSSFSCEAQPHCSNSHACCDDDPLDQNNDHLETYCDLTSFQDLNSVPQAYSSWPLVTPEAVEFPAGQIFLLPLPKKMVEVPLEQLENLLAEASTFSAQIKQERAKEATRPSVPLPNKRFEVGREGRPANIPTVPHPAIIPAELPSPRMPPTVPEVPPPVVKLRPKLSIKNRQYYCNEGNHQCALCNRFFALKRYLTQHMNAQHSGPRNQRCDICGKRFNLLPDLEKHRRRHKAENKKLQCEHCPKKFNYKVDLDRHTKASHTGAPHTCQFCGKGVVRWDHLQQHENKHRQKMIRDEAKQRANRGVEEMSKQSSMTI